MEKININTIKINNIDIFVILDNDTNIYYFYSNMYGCICYADRLNFDNEGRNLYMITYLIHINENKKDIIFSEKNIIKSIKRYINKEIKEIYHYKPDYKIKKENFNKIITIK